MAAEAAISAMRQRPLRGKDGLDAVLTLQGASSSRPCLAALGGMVTPMGVYLLCQNLLPGGSLGALQHAPCRHLLLSGARRMSATAAHARTVEEHRRLGDEMKAALALRAAQKKKTPSFRRTEWFRYKRLSRSGWRAPHGMDNKQRRNYKYRGSLVRIGHGKVAAARFLHPSGFREVMVHNLADLEAVDPETEAARVGATVGGRKREHIYARADELGVRVLNRRRDV